MRQLWLRARVARLPPAARRLWALDLGRKLLGWNNFDATRARDLRDRAIGCHQTVTFRVVDSFKIMGKLLIGILWRSREYDLHARASKRLGMSIDAAIKDHYHTMLWRGQHPAM